MSTFDRVPYNLALEAEKYALTEELREALKTFDASKTTTLVCTLITRNNAIQSYSHTFRELFGSLDKDIIGQPIRLLFKSDEDYAEVNRLALPLLSAAQPFHTELYMRGLNGSDVWVSLTAQAIYSDNTQHDIIWIIEDQTALKNLVHALRESYDTHQDHITERTAELSQQLHFQQQLLESIPGPFFYKDTQFRYLGCNSAFAEFIGRPASELIGKTPYDIAPKELADIYVAADQKLFENPGPQIYESQVRYANGELRDVMFHKATFTRPDGTVGGLIGLILDITERIRMESTLRQAATVFDSSAEGVIITTPNSLIIAVNRAFTEITGYEQNEVIGCNPRVLQSGRQDKKYYQTMWETIARDNRWQGEIWNTRKNGEIYPAWLSIAAVHDKQGKLTNYVATFSDITRQKQNEEKIQLMALSDSLTNLPNRRLLLDRLQQAILANARSKKHGALFFIDLDHFKKLNDTHGHHKGDLLLQQVAQRLANCVRHIDTVARLGGDEFVVMLEDLSTTYSEAIYQAELVGQKILETLNQPYSLDDYLHRSTPSIGVTLFNGLHNSVDELLKQADLAMYCSKKSGRNTLHFFK